MSGIWRRLSPLCRPRLGQRSGRYYANLTGTSTLAGYWPMEIGTGSTQMVPFASPGRDGERHLVRPRVERPQPGGQLEFPRQRRDPTAERCRGDDRHHPGLAGPPPTTTHPALLSQSRRRGMPRPGPQPLERRRDRLRLAHVAKFELARENAMYAAHPAPATPAVPSSPPAPPPTTRGGLNLLVSMEAHPRPAGTWRGRCGDHRRGKRRDHRVGHRHHHRRDGRRGDQGGVRAGQRADGHRGRSPGGRAWAGDLHGAGGHRAERLYRRVRDGPRFTRLCAEMGITTETIGTNTTTAAMGLQCRTTP